MNEYTIYFRVNGEFHVDVTANSLAEAQRKAVKKVESEDFGHLSNIDWYAHYAEDENGNWTDLREDDLT